MRRILLVLACLALAVGLIPQARSFAVAQVAPTPVPSLVPINVSGFTPPSPRPTTTGVFSSPIPLAVGYEMDGNVIAFAPSYDNNPLGGRFSAFGYGAMASETSYAFEEAAFGWNALEYSVQGQFNVALGPEALRYLGTSGTAAGGVNAAQNNLAVGPQALESLCSASTSSPAMAIVNCTNQQGDGNVAVGEEDMYLATTASNDTAVGDNACWQISTGGANVCVGTDSGQNTTTGAYNIAIGVTALGNNTTGGSNIGIGFDAGYTEKTASYDTLVGQQAAYTGSGGLNTSIGYQSLFSQTTGYDNAALGFGAGSNVTTGYNLTLLGYGTEPAVVTDSNEIVVGYSATGGGSNTATIGNQYVTAVETYGGYCPGSLTTRGTACYYSGSGAPTFSAPNGSDYIRYDGTGTGGTIDYRNTSGAGTSGTTWTAQSSIAYNQARRALADMAKTGELQTILADMVKKGELTASLTPVPIATPTSESPAQFVWDWVRNALHVGTK